MAKETTKEKLVDCTVIQCDPESDTFRDRLAKLKAQLEAKNGPPGSENDSMYRKNG